MSDFYHYLDEQRQPQGPLPEEEIARLADAARAAGKEFLVARPGADAWLPFEQARAAAGAQSPQPAPQPAETATTHRL